MKRISLFVFVLFALIFVNASAAARAHAQTMGNTPVLYSQTGTAVNPGGTALSAGYYYLRSGDQVYYYGNGIYYDPFSSTQVYGGHLIDANGNLVYNSVPGAPNTGVGGTSVAVTWFTLAASGIVALIGMMYLGSRRSSLV